MPFKNNETVVIILIILIAFTARIIYVQMEKHQVDDPRIDYIEIGKKFTTIELDENTGVEDFLTFRGMENYQFKKSVRNLSLTELNQKFGDPYSISQKEDIIFYEYSWQNSIIKLETAYNYTEGSSQRSLSIAPNNLHVTDVFEDYIVNELDLEKIQTILWFSKNDELYLGPYILNRNKIVKY